MCGIIGWFGLNIDFDLTTRLREKLTHRGPDSWGEWRGDDMWLAHQRLAILDLSPNGHQPMHSLCGRYVIVFNGEVYNYKSLRTDLEKQGYGFKGDSDTEVVLGACVCWGVEAAVKRFEGMFAFGFYDIANRILWVARDPLGIKPLYYAHAGNNFAFASELSPMLLLPWVDCSIDQGALYGYFRYLCVPAPSSIVNGVKKLDSGSVLRFEKTKVTRSVFWNLPTLASAAKKKSQTITLQEAADGLEIRLRHSIRQHMQSDVPYGAFLSGGIDSSLVVALMQAESSHPVKTFTIGFSEASHDESHYASAVAQHLGTDHHELILAVDELPKLAPLVASLFDEPFADNSSIPTYLVSQFARKAVKVCLSGDGGDELFGGYPRYFWAKRIEKLWRYLTPAGARVLAWMLRVVPNVVWNNIVNPMLGYRFSGTEGLANRVNRFAAYLGCKRINAYAKTMSAWTDPSNLLGFQPKSLLGSDIAQFPQLSWAEEMMLTDQMHYLQDDILTKLDRTSMGVSLEARVPLLTHPIVEWSWQLNSTLKLAEKGDRGKLVMRELLRRYIPEQLIDRPKQGFGMPVAKWLRGSLKDWAESLMEPKDLEDCGLNTGMVRKVWCEHQKGFDRQAMLWTVLMYRQWYTTFVH